MADDTDLPPPIRGYGLDMQDLPERHAQLGAGITESFRATRRPAAMVRRTLCTRHGKRGRGRWGAITGYTDDMPNSLPYWRLPAPRPGA
ncbi:hypothetical protein DMH04_43560 [Kibdelosporangium aridum]|uniref:Uncharacterized protein n=1 Tax=Kibdelosporangium aridum TaxID=2030 RepID=A0A428YRC1_KIBAR|nr:hypothetical protein [Kibdelosporangium aridum]RSM71605.1 hypothetical protein DMH04_43560 [Kibdelosporangium aridum]